MFTFETKMDFTLQNQGMYSKYIKRILDMLLSVIGIILLSPLLILLILIGTIAMKGNPFFVQLRPGKNERIIKVIKFRTMTNAKDKQGDLLPDCERLNKYGKFLRSTSLDELPELFNILKGDLALVGPRPQLVRDMVFMSKDQRRRHSVRQGLTGLAQVNGRNNITWEEKFQFDLQYIDDGITFKKDFKIVLSTLEKVIKRADTVREGTVSDIDYGDYLLLHHKISKEDYSFGQKAAKEILKKHA